MSTPPTHRGSEPGLSVVSADSVTERRGVVSFVSSTDRKGVWDVPRHLRVVAVMGSATIDFRQARVGAGVSDVEIFALMGNVTIIVPPELAAECDVDPLLGSVESEASSAAPAATSDAPRIRVSGSAVLSSIQIEVREAGDDDPFRRRRRAAQRVLDSNPTPPGRRRR